MAIDNAFTTKIQAEEGTPTVSTDFLTGGGPGPDLSPSEHRHLPGRWPRVVLAGIPVDLVEPDDAVDHIIDHAQHGQEALGVVWVDQERLVRFGSGRSSSRHEHSNLVSTGWVGQVRWLALLDEPRLVARAGEITGASWPRLPRLDLVARVLERAQELRLRVGLLAADRRASAGGRAALQKRWPLLTVAGAWSAPRAILDDHETAGQLAAAVHNARLDILVVCLGSPRQERWLAEHGATSGANVCLVVGTSTQVLGAGWTGCTDATATRGMQLVRHVIRDERRKGRHLLAAPAVSRALRRDSHLLQPVVQSDTTSTDLDVAQRERDHVLVVEPDIGGRR